jgi:hypothetical protein
MACVFTALSMLIGAFFASAAAAYGGSLRDEHARGKNTGLQDRQPGFLRGTFAVAITLTPHCTTWKGDSHAIVPMPELRAVALFREHALRTVLL